MKLIKNCRKTSRRELAEIFSAPIPESEGDNPHVIIYNIKYWDWLSEADHSGILEGGYVISLSSLKQMYQDSL